MKAIMFGLIAVFVYGVMVGVQSLIGMFKYDKSCWPLAFGYIAYFLLIPLTLFIPGLYPRMSVDDLDNHSLWKVCLLLLLICMWFILGFFIKASYLRITTGETYWKPKEVAKKRIFIGLGALAIGTAVWLTGLLGKLNFLTGWWEKSTIILSLYLMAQGLILIVRNLKYLKDRPPEQIKTVSRKKRRGKRGKQGEKPAASGSNQSQGQRISYKRRKKKGSAKEKPPQEQNNA